MGPPPQPTGEERLEPVTVLVEDSHLDALERVVDRLEAAGMRVDQTLEAAGVVIGAAPAGRLAALARIAGVAATETSGRSYQLPPPDADIQ